MAEKTSPTGYWAHYDEGDTAFSLPVVAFHPETGIGAFTSTPKLYAMICHQDGYLVRADTWAEDGAFAYVVDNPGE